jgi:hypothetical protein
MPEPAPRPVHTADGHELVATPFSPARQPTVRSRREPLLRVRRPGPCFEESLWRPYLLPAGGLGA